jgi:hypothetical protein
MTAKDLYIWGLASLVATGSLILRDSFNLTVLALTVLTPGVAVFLTRWILILSKTLNAPTNWMELSILSILITVFTITIAQLAGTASPQLTSHPEYRHFLIWLDPVVFFTLLLVIALGLVPFVMRSHKIRTDR